MDSGFLIHVAGPAFINPDMVEQFDAKPAEIRALFSHQLNPTRTAELRDRILAAGLPI